MGAQVADRGLPAAADRMPVDFFEKNLSFADLGLAPFLVRSCTGVGMHYPTKIQAMCIPPVLAGNNVAGNSKTGTGKTACYCLPMLHRLSKNPFGVFGLVLLPIRELTSQIAAVFRVLGKSIQA